MMEKSKLIKYKMIGTVRVGAGTYDFVRPFINGKQKFTRIILKKIVDN